jgi:hypothetical protein
MKVRRSERKGDGEYHEETNRYSSRGEDDGYGCNEQYSRDEGETDGYGRSGGRPRREEEPSFEGAGHGRPKRDEGYGQRQEFGGRQEEYGGRQEAYDQEQSGWFQEQRRSREYGQERSGYDGRVELPEVFGEERSVGEVYLAVESRKRDKMMSIAVTTRMKGMETKDTGKGARMKRDTDGWEDIDSASAHVNDCSEALGLRPRYPLEVEMMNDLDLALYPLLQVWLVLLKY